MGFRPAMSTPSAMMSIGNDRDASDFTSRPRVGLRPTRPQQAAGMRIEPPASLP